MRVDCRLFAVRQEDVEELKACPEIVLGRSLFAGTSMCELQDAGAVLQLISTGTPEQPDHPSRCLASGGTELPAAVGEVRPRLLSVREVQALASALISLAESELQRRFNHQNLVAAVLNHIFAEMEDSEASPLAEFPGSEEDFVEDWTLDQAEEFERIAGQVERLREFAAEAARRRQSLVIFHREETMED